MKKLPLVIAIASLLTASFSFAAENPYMPKTSPTSPTSPQAQIFSKSFDVFVMKESEISVKPPVMDVIDLKAERLKEMVANRATVEIGSMEIESTSKTCYAKVSTMNDFRLKGMESGAILAAYALYYHVDEASATDMSDTSVMPKEGKVKFVSNDNVEQKVSCNTADLKMMPFKYNTKAPVDAYNDVITVEVRAES